MKEAFRKYTLKGKPLSVVVKLFSLKILLFLALLIIRINILQTADYYAFSYSTS
jgi:hypothetical protein